MELEEWDELPAYVYALYRRVNRQDIYFKLLSGRLLVQEKRLTEFLKTEFDTLEEYRGIFESAGGRLYIRPFAPMDKSQDKNTALSVGYDPLIPELIDYRTRAFDLEFMNSEDWLLTPPAN